MDEAFGKLWGGPGAGDEDHEGEPAPLMLFAPREYMTKERIQVIYSPALTLGDMQLATRFLRPRGESTVQVIESGITAQVLKVLIKGFARRPPRVEAEPDLGNPVLEDVVPGSTVEVASHLYSACAAQII